MGIEPSGNQRFFGPTIVRRLVGLHKGVRRAAIACALGLWIPFSAGWAQRQSTAQIVGVSDVAAVVGGAALFAAPHLLHVNAGPPECAPCDPANVPWFDRWVIATPRPGWDAASDIAVLGIAGGGWADLAHRGDDGAAGVAASIASVALAVGVTELAKAVAGRSRPVLYTAGAPEAARHLDSRRSWPSGHTAAAFALATSLWLSRRRLGDEGPPVWAAWAALGAATGVAVFRVAAAKHFPSDVLAGLIVGVGTAAINHEIKF